ncbi:penicillin-binding protein 1C [Thiofilum flexile]|uniref:penicillin-binding protein 1C n=1 Tax=Thiofilum flexile TaxID=125627 RepID=UPI00037B3BAE|nr:penicillin-binding protein 1C [Thiofilum flexile]
MTHLSPEAQNHQPIRRYYGLMVLPTLIVLFLGFSAWWYWLAVPDELFAAPTSNVVLDRHGKLLSAQIAEDEQWRFPDIDQVPEKFATAITLFEDKRFNTHWGVDPVALLRAAYLNLRQRRVVSGGSTLTMQVIRLSRHNPARTLGEKVMEMARALRLESRLDKAAILKLYASHAPFGGNVVGLEAAAWRYFGRDPAQLSWAESAMLAVLPNNPALVHLSRNRQRLLNKRNALLKRLHEQHYLSELDYKLAVAEPLPDAPHALPRLAPHLLDTLALKQREGQRFHTTIDGVLQQQLQNLTQRTGEQLALEGINNLAVLVIDNKTFEVRAYQGNRPSINPQTDGYAIDLIQRPRSTGSTLKPLLFAAMLEQGLIVPDSLIADVPISYTGFTPQNYDRAYRGAVPAHEALARSLNIPAVNMLSQYGVQPFQILLQQIGMQYLKRPARDYGLSLILGGAEGSLWEITHLYANLAYLAAQEPYTTPRHWQRAKVLASQATETERIVSLSTASAWLTVEALIEVARPGDEGYWEKFSSSQRVAWKTGTSYGHRDAWAIGITPLYTVGVWVGNASGEGRNGLTGTLSAAPLLFNTFNLLPTSSEWFAKPEWQLSKIAVCKDDGYLSNGQCMTKQVDAPQGGRFTRLSPYHQLIHLDSSGQWRVTSDCEPVYQMQTRNWFILPPDQAYYYRQHHANYQPLPPFRADCQALDNSQSEAIALVYPRPNTQIYLPRELDGKRNQVVFRAVPRRPETLLYWHVDDQFVGTTQTFHSQALTIPVGEHKVAVVDEVGNRVEQNFQVLYGEQH